jgi:hypothetical protein
MLGRRQERMVSKPTEVHHLASRLAPRVNGYQIRVFLLEVGKGT